MSSKIQEIRRTVLPQDIFQMIEGYMMGDIVALHVIAVTKDQRVIRVSAGQVPDFVSANDSDISAELKHRTP